MSTTGKWVVALGLGLVGGYALISFVRKKPEGAQAKQAEGKTPAAKATEASPAPTALSSKRNPTRVFLFDVDGTLTAPRKEIEAPMREFITKLRKDNVIAIVGGSDLSKQVEQIGKDVLKEWDYVFSENGLDAYKDGKSVARQSFKLFMGEEKLQKFINFVLRYIADLNIPIKRGTFIEFRNGMLNVSPIGRNCSQSERDDFEKFDEKAQVRKTMVAVLEKEFASFNLKYSIGGQISFDVFPEGWDKTYCLPFLKKDGFTEIHFFGDKTSKGGNDYEIFASSETIGHTVTSPEDCIKQVSAILNANKSAL